MGSNHKCLLVDLNIYKLYYRIYLTGKSIGKSSAIKIDETNLDNIKEMLIVNVNPMYMYVHMF